MAYEWFISYRRKTGGEQQARQVADILTKYVGKGKVFYDRESIREGNWREQIENALSTAEHFVLLVNEASAAENLPHTPGSYYYEIEYALKSEKLKKDRITPIIYDNESLKTLQIRVNGLDAIREDQRVTFVGEYGFAFEDRLCNHFGFTTAERVIHNIAFPQNLIPREDMLKKLRDKFNSHDCVIVSGIGGSGKTSLAYLYAKEQPFDNIAWITVNGKIEDVIVDKMAGLIFNPNDYIKFVQIPDREYKLDNIKKILFGISGKNFLVLDINTNNEEIKQEIETELYNYLPAENWKTLVLTRTHPASDDGFFEVVEMDKMAGDDAQELFKSNWKRQGIVFTKEQLAEITKELHLHPLLIEQTAIVFSKNGHEKTAEQIIKKIKGNSKIKNERTKAILGSLVAKGKTERQDIYTYLINLCKVENLSKEEIDFLAVYVTWSDEPIDYEAIETLMINNIIASPIVKKMVENSDDEKMKQLVNETLNEYKARQIIQFSYENAEDEETKQFFKEIIDKFNGEDSNATLDTLVDKGILSRNDKDQYSLHSLIADVLREQIDITTHDYTEYLNHIAYLIKGGIHVVQLCKFFQDTIASGFIYYGICKNIVLFISFLNLVRWCCRKTFVCNLPEPAYSNLLKTMERKAEPRELVDLFYAEAGVDIMRGKTYNVKIHYENALKIMNDLEDNEQNLHLKRNLHRELTNFCDLDSTKKHYEEALEIARKIAKLTNNFEEIVHDLRDLSDLELKLENLESCRKHLEEAIEIQKNNINTSEICLEGQMLERLLKRLALLEELKLGDFDSAKKHFEEALVIHIKYGDQSGQMFWYEKADIHWELGLINFNLGDLDSAQKHLEEALEIRKNLPDTPANLYQIANILAELGTIAVKLNKFDSAETLWNEALGIYRQINNENYISRLEQLLSLLEKVPEKLKAILLS